MNFNYPDIPKLELLASKLEIFIITYNRSLLLANTIDQLCNSPFSFCKITVLDNCSTDNTLEIANEQKNKFKDFNVISHKINIGAGANALRAIEMSNGLYTWLLCDDDNYDFSDCSDVIDVILNEKYDLIHMGAHKEFWKYGAYSASPKDLMNMGYPYFKYSSFVPCNLFRTQRFYDSINIAYENINCWFPHMPFLLDFFKNGDQVYTAKNQIVTASISYSGSLGNTVLKKWAILADLLTENQDKLLFILNQGIVVRKNKNTSLNKVLMSYGLNVIYNKNFQIIFKIFRYAGLEQSILIFFSILFSPAWYLKRTFLTKDV
jgi:glycosyltransferase involved in cell wall biosynthesis